jgi:poly [ADP-ribose] polymerase
MPPKNRKRQQKKEEDQPDDEVELNPDAMTVAQLKAELGNRGLDITGKKAQLTQRLKEALETDEPKPSKKLKIEKDDEEEEGKSTFSKAATALRQADAKEKKKRQPKVDTLVPISSRYSVVGEYDCMLNQTNIGQNNNKFYIIQLLTDTFGYNVWTRWGRVGEPGQNAMKRIGDLSSAEKEFRKKFKDKTKNDWDKRDNFTPQPGKYTLLDMGDDDGEEEDVPMEVVQETDKGVAKKIRACTLDKDTMTLVKLLFDNDMFKEAMQSLEIGKCLMLFPP